ncbi:nitrate ABC transporter permease [Comamonas sp.]|uniref:nitrate ABC transporter permease n=1 Tax=Comamonas sp. TaxID=34028 RepID=UPI0012CC2103|nr:nitrate ABC transporter permease [Comamonas sp.]MPS93100.1 nitrate ABC transporter, permease protein [Comamonas sp.]
MVSAALHSPLELDPPHDPQLAALAANDAQLETAEKTAGNADIARAEVKKDTAVVKAPPSVISTPPGRWRRRAEAFAGQVLPPLLGLALLVGLWSLVSSTTGKSIPTPAETWEQALQVFSDPFYRNGPNDQGVGWNVLSSLQRVALGFGLAALVGIPLGFVIGRFSFLSRMFNPLISLLRPVSPLAWLPIGLLVFKGANPAAIWTIFICSIWPMVINTAVGVQRVPQDYMNVARVLNLSEWKIATTILFPAVLPYMLTGVRLAVGTAWLVIVAAEMLTGGVGIGFWVWDEWNNLNVKNIIIAIFVIGIVGLVLEWALVKLASAFTFEEVKT